MLVSLTLPFIIGSEDAQECLTQIPACQGVTDFGPLPRARYPLVAVLTLAEPVGRHIVSPFDSNCRSLLKDSQVCTGENVFFLLGRQYNHYSRS